VSRPISQRSYADIRADLLAGEEIALLDVREEDPHAQAHPLFAANLPLARIELDAYAKLPRRDVAIVTLDDGEGYAAVAARRLRELGYSKVSTLAGGIEGWRAAGGELFRDVNVPSKAFGELVEAQRHTPSLAAEEVQALIDAHADIVIVDVRRFDEYQTMSIPTATSVPGGEVVLRIGELAVRPETQVIVNCAGRTRSIIGTQSLINAGIANPVAALRNGTIGWTLAGQTLDRGQSRRITTVNDCRRRQAANAARALADRAGARRAGRAEIEEWRRQDGRTSYFFDVRSAEEYVAGHLPGFRPVAGGQLVQETEMVAPVRGARIVVADDDGVRANMSASWLAQMGWEVWVAEFAGDKPAADFSEKGPWQAPLPALPAVREISAQTLAGWREEGSDTIVLDFTTSASYRRAHIPGAWFVLRSRLSDDFARLPGARRYVLTCRTSLLANFVVAELEALLALRPPAQGPAAAGAGAEVVVLAGGTEAWSAAGFAIETGDAKFASPAIDRYRRPYEGTDNAHAAMQAYLDWEYGLVDQLGRDGTHGFRVI
jgi:rhodanese-related sulfurtransferase